LLEPNDAIRQALRDKAERQTLAGLAHALGCAGLWQRGLTLAADGYTTCAELRRALVPDNA
jgi:type II secretory ATPase GspE/PulE/Tfp pilus assembly ATPase PilB-like protein